MARKKKPVKSSAELYKESCRDLDAMAMAMGARAVIVTYRMDENDKLANIAVNGGCCMEHVVRSLAAGINYVIDHSHPADDHADEEEVDEDFVEGVTTIN